MIIEDIIIEVDKTIHDGIRFLRKNIDKISNENDEECYKEIISLSGLKEGLATLRNYLIGDSQSGKYGDRAYIHAAIDTYTNLERIYKNNKLAGVFWKYLHGEDVTLPTFDHYLEPEYLCQQETLINNLQIIQRNETSSPSDQAGSRNTEEGERTRESRLEEDNTARENDIRLLRKSIVNDRFGYFDVKDRLINEFVNKLDREENRAQVHKILIRCKWIRDCRKDFTKSFLQRRSKGISNLIKDYINEKIDFNDVLTLLNTQNGYIRDYVKGG